MKKLSIVTIAVIMAVGAQAAIIFTDDFSAGTIDTQWNNNLNAEATLDTVNQEVDFSHTATTNNRFQSYSPSLLNGSNLGYFKADISNLSGSKTWMAFIGDNNANSTYYASVPINANGTYELFINTTAASVTYSNGGSVSGTLLPGTGVWSIDDGTSSGALIFGSNFVTNQIIRGFGYASFGNATVFPTTSFSVDNVVVANTTVIPEPGTLGLLGLASAGLYAARRFRIV